MNIQTIKTAVQKHRIPTIASALALLLTGMFLFRGSAMNDTQAALDEAREQGARLSANISNASQIGEHLAAIQQAEKLILGRLISPAELAINQQYFYKIEAETDVKFLDLRQNSSSPPKGKAKTNYVPVAFSVALQGTYPKVLTFLRRLEQGSAYCTIVTASAIQPGNDEKGSLVTLNLSLELLGRP